MAVPDVQLPEDWGAYVDNPEPRIILNGPDVAGNMIRRAMSVQEAIDLWHALDKAIAMAQGNRPCDCPCRK